MWRVRNRFLGYVLKKRDSCSFFLLKFSPPWEVSVRISIGWVGFISCLHLFASHLLLLHVPRPFESMGSTEHPCLEQDSFCLLDWVLPFSVTSSNRGLEPHLLCFHKGAVTSGSYQQIFPNFHCWLCWHQLWRGVEVKGVEVSSQLMMCEVVPFPELMSIPETMTVESFSTSCSSAI